MKQLVRRFALLLIGLFLFVGLALIGWGIFDLAAFLGNPARLGFVIVTVIMQVATVILVPNVGQHDDEGTSLVRRQKLALLALQILIIALVIIAPCSDGHSWAAYAAIDWLRYVGLAVYAIGFVVMTWAQVRLGRQFSVQVTLQEDHVLITDGPYRFLRHPRYLGIILFSTGISMIFRSAAGLGLVVLIAAVLIWRIVDEETLIHRQFGEAWEAYRRRTWRLVPWIY